MIRIKKNIRGFSLIEVMFAVMALSFGLTILLRSFMISLEAIKRLENTLVASHLLEEKMEDVKKSAAEIGGTTQGSTSAPFNYENQKNIAYSWQLDVEESDQGDYLNQVTLLVLWNEANKNRSLESVVYLKNLDYEEDENETSTE